MADAVWLRGRQLQEQRRRMPARAGAPSFCLGALVALIALIALASGGLRATRDVLLPLPYEEPERIATVAHGGMLVATRAAVRVRWTGWWRSQSRVLSGAASYTWQDEPITDTTGCGTEGR